MSAMTWLIIGIVGFTLAGVFLITAGVMFFKMRILSVIGDITGKTTLRGVQAIRNTEETKSNYRSESDQDVAVREVAVAKTEDKSLEAVKKGGTVKLSTGTEKLPDMSTEVLVKKTEKLDNKTMVLDNRTIALEDEPEKLSITEELTEMPPEPVAFNITKNKILIHTNEMI